MELQGIKLEETPYFSDRAYFCVLIYLQFSSFLHAQKSPAPTSKLVSKH